MTENSALDFAISVLFYAPIKYKNLDKYYYFRWKKAASSVFVSAMLLFASTFVAVTSIPMLSTTTDQAAYAVNADGSSSNSSNSSSTSSGQNDKIAFTADDGDIYVMNAADGSEKVNLSKDSKRYETI